MADIKINNIKVTGADLFSDTESFLNELSNDEMKIKGGDWSTASRGCGGVDDDEWSTFSNKCRDVSFFEVAR